MEGVQSDILLQAKNLTIWRGENLLIDDVTVFVRAGSVVQVQGSNGSGKTTMLRALIGLAEIDDGDILWRGAAVHKVRTEFHSELIYLGHKPGITGGLTPFENLLALCPEFANSEGPQSLKRDKVINVLAELGIADRIELPSAALSAGQQRRVSLARLRLQQATLWVLDEPLTSLDRDGYEWVKNEIENHVKRGGAVLFTTHQAMSFDAIPVHTITLAAES